MSIETVRNKCIANMPDINTEKLDVDIQKQIQRFEKIVKTSYNEGLCHAMYSFEENPTAAKNQYFEKHKLEYIHQHLTMLIDLFDYKYPESLKKSS